ncbi:MAG TPA: hypothetical protein VIL64_05595 [Solirubrobacteraceae bacterium]
MSGTVVDTHALVQLLWVSFATGLGLTLTFSLGLAGATRASQARRAGRAMAAGVFAAIALLCAALVVATVVLGVAIMINKS